jgi:hypothetical protein
VFNRSLYRDKKVVGFVRFRAPFSAMTKPILSVGAKEKQVING